MIDPRLDEAKAHIAAARKLLAALKSDFGGPGPMSRFPRAIGHLRDAWLEVDILQRPGIQPVKNGEKHGV